MRTISTALRTHLALPYTSMVTCWLCSQVTGDIFAFTDAAQGFDFDLEAAMIALGLTPGPGIEDTGTQTYDAVAGFNASDIASNMGLSVDTGQAIGALQAPTLTESTVLAGDWDYCTFTIFQVNEADLSMGPIIQRYGRIGDIDLDLGFFRASWRGLMEAYQSNIGEFTTPYCRANLGDARCKIDLGPFTVTGTLTGVSSDGVTFFDTARTEPGPIAGVSIVSISNGNPATVVMSGPGTFVNNDTIIISGARGMSLINSIWAMRSLVGSTFSLPIDTLDTGLYPAYTGGGIVSPIGGGLGFFAYGLFTALSGPNAGRSMEVKRSDVGTWTNRLPLSRALCTVGDSYQLIAGCDKALNTCRDTYNNVDNRRAEDYIPGWNKMVQIARTT